MLGPFLFIWMRWIDYNVCDMVIPFSAHTRVIMTEFPVFLGADWSRCGPQGTVEFWRAGADGGFVAVRVLSARANRLFDHFVPSDGLAIVERVPHGVDGFPGACRVTIPIGDRTSK